RAVARGTEGGTVGNAEVGFVEEQLAGTDVFGQVEVGEGGLHHLADEGDPARSADEDDVVDVGERDAGTLPGAGEGLMAATDRTGDLVADEALELGAGDTGFERQVPAIAQGEDARDVAVHGVVAGEVDL